MEQNVPNWFSTQASNWFPTQVQSSNWFSTQVCAILTNYLICTVPAATVLAVDPSAKMLSKVPTMNLPQLYLHIFLSILGTYSNVYDLLAGRRHQPFSICSLQSGIQVNRFYLIHTWQNNWGTYRFIANKQTHLFTMFQGVFLRTV